MTLQKLLSYHYHQNFKKCKNYLNYKNFKINYKNYFNTKITLIISLQSGFIKDLIDMTKVTNLRIALLVFSQRLMLQTQMHILLQKVCPLDWKRHLKNPCVHLLAKLQNEGEKKVLYRTIF